MPAEMPRNMELLLTDAKKGAFHWVIPSMVNKIKSLCETHATLELDDWKQEDIKSTNYNLRINELINTTRKAEITIKPSALQKETSKTYSRRELFKEICSFRSLKNNWDGYDAIPLEVESAANAMLIISLLPSYLSESIDQVSPNPHGTISIIWNNSNDETVSLEVGNKEMSYYVDEKGKKTEFFDNIVINESEISKLSACVSRIL